MAASGGNLKNRLVIFVTVKSHHTAITNGCQPRRRQFWNRILEEELRKIDVREIRKLLGLSMLE